MALADRNLGQGAFTVAAQMAAAALGVPYESVRVATPVDTRYSPYEWQTVASRLTWSMGNAVVNAAKDARQQVLDTGGRSLGREPRRPGHRQRHGDLVQEARRRSRSRTS
ncbi:MAG: molybdopterin-dependent oxidoreductase [Candidatus Moduliflexus flocculans]|nr:molybdopterin-dependent oxidoreductase [Candidatus Moduliflexus flocculans]